METAVGNSDLTKVWVLPEKEFNKIRRKRKFFMSDGVDMLNVLLSALACEILFSNTASFP